ncbi:2903_t:CDS:2 [Ambispora leptoticha]|uniref:2903_t:CDS:1 n=1 Tax=Ambispora leptoticha TaxID=144679 RepID=A0A9N9C031_9GLOM|nr:2903_t:CDS:2 [Ambispora leptoticha]
MVVKKSSTKTVKKLTNRKRVEKPKNNSHEYDDRENQNVDELTLDVGECDKETSTKKTTSKRKTITLESSSFKKAKQVKANKKHPSDNNFVADQTSTCKESFDMHLASLKNKYAGWCAKHPNGYVTEDKPPQRNTTPEFWICCAED